MKQFDVKIEKQVLASEKLPAGGYVAKIVGAEVRTFKTKDGGELEKLCIAFDIAEGEHKLFFSKQFKENTSPDKKWKGTYQLFVPDQDSQYFESQKRSFGNFLWAVQESNSGYRWGWDEKSLINKDIGVLYRNREWEMDGNTGWTTECGAITDVSSIRSGNFKPLKDKPLKDKPESAGASSPAEFREVDLNAGDLPF